MSATSLKQVERLSRDIGAVIDLVRALSTEVDQLKARLKAIEEKRGPGRPKKQ